MASLETVQIASRRKSRGKIRQLAFHWQSAFQKSRGRSKQNSISWALIGPILL
jgi:hypothetical protein